MLHARRHPRANVGPVSLYLHYGIQGELPVVFNGLSLVFVAGGNAERRIPVALAQRDNDVVERVLIVRRLDDKHGSFEVVSQIGSIVAVIVLVVVLLQTLRKGIASALVLDKRKQVLCHCFDRLHLGEGRKVLGNKEAAVGHCVYLSLFGVLEEVVRVEISSYSSRRHSGDHDRVSVVEIELFVQITELLHHVVVSSKVELHVLVRNGVFSAA